MTTTTRTTYNELVGIHNGEYYGLDSIFDHGSFKGATGTVLTALTPAIAQQYREEYDFEELWKDAVASDATEMGLTAWSEMVRNIDGDLTFFDPSGSVYEDAIRTHFEESTGEEMELTDCRGGGRCFSVDMVWDELLRPDLWALIVAAES